MPLTFANLRTSFARSAALAVCVAVLPLTAPSSAHAQTPEVQTPEALVARVVDVHVLPRIARLETETAALAETAQGDCNPFSPALRTAFGTAFDAWIEVSHLAFGPMETDNRLFALSFWPDARAATPRSLAQLIEAQDAAVENPETFAEVSVAARGFYGLEFLLYDSRIISMGDEAYHCQLVQAVTADIHATSQAIAQEWQAEHGDLMRFAGDNDLYQDPDEALRQLLGALIHGLEMAIDLRLGRPLGTVEAPRPMRAEARRSGRSLRHVQLALASMAEMAAQIGPDKAELQEGLARVFAAAQTRADMLDDPVFVTVDDPAGRIHVEDLQTRVHRVLEFIQNDLAFALGVGGGFNAMDGD